MAASGRRSRGRSASRSYDLRQRINELGMRVRGHRVLRRVGQWIDGLQTDVRGAARDRLSQVGAMATRAARQLLDPVAGGPRAHVNATGVLALRELGLPLAEQAMSEMLLVGRDYSGGDELCPVSLGTLGAVADTPPSIGVSLPGPAAALQSVEALVREFTGAEAALVFANEGAAAVATLSALAARRQVIIARGQITRLHGDFALPQAAAAARSRLCEIGTTASCSLEEYRQALGPRAALVVHSQPAEYQLVGHNLQPSCEELAALTTAYQTRTAGRVPVLAHLPSAMLLALPVAATSHLPLVGQSLLSGADLVLFRGDTCAGGPGVAIVAGRRDLIDRIANQPLSAVLAADPLSTSALAATLRLYRTPEIAVRCIPLFELLSASAENLKHRAERLAPQLRQSRSIGRVEIVPSSGWLGPARLSAERLPSWTLRLQPRTGSAERLAQDLAAGSPSILAEVDETCVRINLRSILPRQDEQLVAALRVDLDWLHSERASAARRETEPAALPLPVDAAPPARRQNPPSDILGQAE